MMMRNTGFFIVEVDHFFVIGIFFPSDSKFHFLSVEEEILVFAHTKQKYQPQLRRNNFFF